MPALPQHHQDRPEFDLENLKYAGDPKLLKALGHPRRHYQEHGCEVVKYDNVDSMVWYIPAYNWAVGWFWKSIRTVCR